MTMTHRPATLRGRWVAMVLATLLAVLGQGFLTQTHLHFDASQRARTLAGPATAPAGLRTGQATPDLPVCPICQEAAQAGAYLASAAPVFVAPTVTSHHGIVLPAPTLAPRLDSHDWRSRAPPLPLHA